MIDEELEKHQQHKEFVSDCSYCQKDFEAITKQKEIEELSKQLLAKEKWCVIIDRPCLKERCSWYDIAEERCIIITIANILAGQKIFKG